MPAASKGPSFSSGAPGQPTQVPWLRCMTGSSAVTSPPGLARQCSEPSGSVTRSRGSRLATTTNGASPECAIACTLRPFERRSGWVDVMSEPVNRPGPTTELAPGPATATAKCVAAPGPQELSKRGKTVCSRMSFMPAAIGIATRAPTDAQQGAAN